MAGFEVGFSKDAAKQYGRLPKEYKTLVDVALSGFSEGLERDLQPVEGQTDVYRIRVGKYRILFRRFASTILVFRIAPRGDAYK